MNRIRILDCTLRDGGYINDFRFGHFVITDMLRKMNGSGIEIIECGFLRSGCFDKDCTLFASVEQIREFLPQNKQRIMYVAMIQYGDISKEEISSFDGTSVDGIRLTFHEHEIEDAFIFGQQLMDKGYKVFMQPVGTMTYTDQALLSLIDKVNDLRPFAFYLVDTLGTMYKNDLLRMYYLVDHNLDKQIIIGFHSHNNLQLSFANAQELMQLNTSREIIIDTSIYGMGRGAGNLCTELVTQYINENLTNRYDNIAVLEIIDEYIKPLSTQYSWGYDVAYYIAATGRCHPNYASYLLNMQTMRVPDIHAILSSMDEAKRALYDKEYIAKLYLEYMENAIDDKASVQNLRNEVGIQEVLILAPGKSLRSKIKTINDYIKKTKCYVISVNFIPTDISVNAVFISNMKRFSSIENILASPVKIIATSNIVPKTSENLIVVNYSNYINTDARIIDNAGLMCINLMCSINVADIVLAGFDGFSLNRKENYYDDSMIMSIDQERLVQMNDAMKTQFEQISKKINLTFITDTIYGEVK